MAKKQKPEIVPRRGPATNLRKAGAHEDKRRKAQERPADDDQELRDLETLGSWAYDDE
ncbi:MAG: hypothetical protein JO113_02050 [Candidatus Eremiobacteraeota bacterium]|nr:hypothetical protein [Candidatus Eremiobacteraeota bacterium]